MSLFRALKKQLRQFFLDKLNPSNESLLKGSDVFLASYPRSGNTWCRVILAHLLYPDFELGQMDNINNYIPAIHKRFPKTSGYSEPRIIKTHEAFHYRMGKKNEELYKKNIYVVRNVFDVIKSYYHFKKARGRLEGIDLNEFAQRMAYGMYGPGLWQEHILGWYGAGLHHGKTLLVKYEDLLADPVKEIERMAAFLNIQKTKAECQKIVENSNIQKMRKAQDRGAIGRIPEFVRSGAERLPNLTFDPKTIQLVYQNNRVAMDLLGYTLAENLTDK